MVEPPKGNARLYQLDLELVRRAVRLDDFLRSHGYGRLLLVAASRSSFAATVAAPSARIVPATALARARVSEVRAVVSAADRETTVGVGPSCVAPMPSSATRVAQYGWSAILWGAKSRPARLSCVVGSARAKRHDRVLCPRIHSS